MRMAKVILVCRGLVICGSGMRATMALRTEGIYVRYTKCERTTVDVKSLSGTRKRWVLKRLLLPRSFRSWDYVSNGR